MGFLLDDINKYHVGLLLDEGYSQMIWKAYKHIEIMWLKYSMFQRSGSPPDSNLNIEAAILSIFTWK